MKLSPCGLVMDYLRSGYRVYMRFAPDEPAQPVVWHRAEPHAPHFPGHHRFASMNWEEDHDNEGIGEDAESDRPWRNGKPPVIYTSTKPCGKLDWFRDGVPAGDTSAFLVLDQAGVPNCCSAIRFPLMLTGGAAVTYSPTLTVPTVCFPFRPISPFLLWEGVPPLTGPTWTGVSVPLAYDPATGRWTGDGVTNTAVPFNVWMRCDGAGWEGQMTLPGPTVIDLGYGGFSDPPAVWFGGGPIEYPAGHFEGLVARVTEQPR